MESISITADRRERRSSIPAALVAHGAEVEERHLFVADYLVSDRVVVARRTGRDLDAAIADGRLFRQVATLLSTYPSVVLLVVGPGAGVLSAASRRGALAWVARQGVPVLHADDADDAAAWLITLARQEARRPRDILLLAQRKAVEPDEQLVQLVATLPGIGPTCARRLLTRFGTLADLVAADVTDLRGVRGIGPKRAEALAALFGHRYSNAADDADEARALTALAS